MRFVIWKRHMWVCHFSTFIRSTSSWILLLELWYLPAAGQRDRWMNKMIKSRKRFANRHIKGWKSFLSFLKARYKSSNFNFHQQLNKITTKTVKNQLHRRWAGHKRIVNEPLITCNMRGFTPKFCLYAMKQCSWVLWGRVSSCDFLCVNCDIRNKFLGFSFSFWMMATGG